MARTQMTRTIHQRTDGSGERSKITQQPYDRHQHEPYYRLHHQRGPCRRNWVARCERHILAADRAYDDTALGEVQ